MNAQGHATLNQSASAIIGGRYVVTDETSGRPALLFIIFSISFHVLAFIAFAGQFSLFQKDNDFEDTIIVEMVDGAVVREQMETPKSKPEPIKKAAPKSEGVKPTPPKPEPVVEDITEEKKEVEPKAVVEDVPELKKPEPAPSKPKPPEPKKDEKKPEPKVEEKPKTVDKPKVVDFQSVLKNLAPEDVKPSINDILDDVQDDDKSLRQAPVLTQPPPVSEQVSMTEMQALISQLGSCWSILSGAKDAASLYVDVNLVMNPDRTVREATIVDRARYNRDSFFKAAADSALRALNNPRCKQLNLPPYKYDQWKTMTVRFDPKQMF